MLAVLTETLDSIPVDEDGLPSFGALADGDVTNASDQSCPSSPDGSPRTPEPEETSLVRPAARALLTARVQPESILRRDLLNRLPSVAPMPVCGRHEISLFHQTGRRVCLVDSQRLAVTDSHSATLAAMCARRVIRACEKAWFANVRRERERARRRCRCTAQEINGMNQCLPLGANYITVL